MCQNNGRLVPGGFGSFCVNINGTVYELHQAKKDDIEINRKVFYQTLDDAAMVAANKIYDMHNGILFKRRECDPTTWEMAIKIYNMSDEEKIIVEITKYLNERPEKEKQLNQILKQSEYGISIYEVGTKFCLTTPITIGGMGEVYPDYSLGRWGEKFMAHVHSHPRLIGQTFSIRDFITSYDKQSICYLLIGQDGVGNDGIANVGELMKFLPPKKGDSTMKELKINDEQIQYKHGLIILKNGGRSGTPILVPQDPWDIDKNTYEKFKKDNSINYIGHIYIEGRQKQADDLSDDAYRQYLCDYRKILNNVFDRLMERKLITTVALNQNVKSIPNLFAY